jgi:Brp/Blh family beta-carotene 15,15'-monooxygenase
MFRNFAIILTFFALWLSGYFSEPSQNALAFLLIFSIGILHGSNDLAIIAKWRPDSTRMQLYYLFGSYIGTVLVAALLFYFLPSVALLAFILLSAHHFGEQHWARASWLPIRETIWFCVAYGLSVLFLLFYLNADQTNIVISTLTGIEPDDLWYLYGALAATVIWLIPVLSIVYFRPEHIWKLVFEIFLMLVFAVVFKTATLVWAFAIYFIFWHSIPSMLEQLSFLHGETTVRSFRKYLRSAALVWLISLAALIGIYLWIKDKEGLFVPLFFAFLGAITFAHTVIMHKMFSTSSRK